LVLLIVPTRYVTGFVLVSGLWLVVLGVAGRDLVRFVYTERWLPAVTANWYVAAAYAIVAALIGVRVKKHHSNAWGQSRDSDPLL